MGEPAEFDRVMDRSTAKALTIARGEEAIERLGLLRRMNRLMLRPRPIAAGVVASAIGGSSDVSNGPQDQTDAVTCEVP
jgi:hypothetical protein